MLLIVLVCSLSLAATGQQDQDDWIDPYDMFNYDASTKTMRKPAKPNIITTVITGLQKYFGEGISKFHQAFKDLPVHLQIMVSMAVVFCILVFIYLNCRPGRNPLPAQMQEPQHHSREIKDRDHLADEDAPQPVLRQQDNDDQLHGNQVRQRHVSKPKEEPGKVAVKTLRPAEPHNSEDEKDARLSEEEQNLAAESDSENQQDNDDQLHGNQVPQRHVSKPKEEPGKVAVKTLRPAEPHNSEDEKDAHLSEEEQNLAAESDSENQQDNDDQLHGNQVPQRHVSKPKEEPGKVAVKTLRPAEPHNSEDEKVARLSEEEQNLAAESDSGNQQKTQEERVGASASSVTAITAQSETGSDSSPSTSEKAERRPSQTDVQDLQASAQDSDFSALLEQTETLPASIQETRPVLAE